MPCTILEVVLIGDLPPVALESVMRPIRNFQSDLFRDRSFYDKARTVFVAVAIGGIASATVILSLAWPPSAEPSIYVVKLETATAFPLAELPPALATATPEITSIVDIARTTHKLGVHTERKVQNHPARVASRGRHHYRNFARYFAPRFSASW